MTNHHKGGNWNQTLYAPGGEWKQYFWYCMRGGRTKRGVTETYHRTKAKIWDMNSLSICDGYIGGKELSEDLFVWLPPAYVVWREGTVFTGVCLLTFWGGTPSRSGWWRGGTPSQVLSGWWGSTPSQVWGGYPSQVWMVYPHPGGYPGQVLTMGGTHTPLARSGWWGVPGVSPIKTWPG